MDGLGRQYKSERERQILYHITYTWNLKIHQTSEYNKRSRITDTENKLMVTSEEREGGRGNMRWGIKRYKQIK